MQKPMYKVRTENDVNAYDSDKWEGQQSFNPPFSDENPFSPPVEACPNADLQGGCPVPIDDTPPRIPNLQNIRTPCAGKYFTVTSEGTFLDNGGSHTKGELWRYCDTKIVLVEKGVTSKVICMWNMVAKKMKRTQSGCTRIRATRHVWWRLLGFHR